MYTTRMHSEVAAIRITEKNRSGETLPPPARSQLTTARRDGSTARRGVPQRDVRRKVVEPQRTAGEFLYLIPNEAMCVFLVVDE